MFFTTVLTRPLLWSSPAIAFDVIERGRTTTIAKHLMSILVGQLSMAVLAFYRTF
jgi:hypothetical protein